MGGGVLDNANEHGRVIINIHIYNFQSDKTFGFLLITKRHSE